MTVNAAISIKEELDKLLPAEATTIVMIPTTIKKIVIRSIDAVVMRKEKF